MLKKIYLKENVSEEERIAAEAERDYKYYSSLGKRKGYASGILFLATLAALALSLFLILAPSDMSFVIGGEAFDKPLGKGVLGVAIGVAISAYVANLFFSYLRPGEISRSEAVGTGQRTDKLLGSYERRLAAIERRYDSILEKLQGGAGGGEIFSEEERKQILDDLKRRLESDVFEDYFNGLILRVRESLKFKQREDVFAKTIARLEVEIQNQSKRGNVNLLLGIFTTIFGVLVLGYSVLQAPIFKDAMEITSHFLPRISLVIVIEIFAYFFLRLYKQSLDEIKFFQNEMTNVESKYLGLYVAAEGEYKEGMLAVINQLSSTERNFILEKGQSTVSLEQKKVDAATNSTALEGVTSILSEYIKRK